MIKRGEIYYARLHDSNGSEQEGYRPVIIVQNDTGNYHSSTLIVIPITSSPKRYLPTHVDLGRNYGLYLYSTALAEQIITIDRQRIDEYIGTIDDFKMTEIDKALKVSLGVNYNDEQ